MELSKQDRDALERLEEELWREETRFDSRRMNELIAPDFFEFGRSGRVYRREDTLAVPRGPIDAVFPLPGFRARSLGRDLAQVTYDSAVTYGGVVQHARRSSIWSRTPDGWVLRFHQGTPIPDDAGPAGPGEPPGRRTR
jgi:hypothetical protein